MKKLSLLLLTVLTVFVANAWTVKFTNPQAWEKVYVYTYKDGAPTEGAWPGAEMTKSGDVWSYEGTAASDYIIFNNGVGGDGNQTGDFSFSDGATYDMNGIQGAGTSTELTYTLHGQIFDGQDWTSNQLMPQDGKYVWSGTITTGGFGIQVFSGSSQVNWLCAENEGNSQVNAEGTYKAGNDTGNNWYNTLEGNYTFTLDPAAMTLTIAKVGTDTPPTPTELTYTLHGQIFDGQDWTSNQLMPQDGKYVWSGKITTGGFGIQVFSGSSQVNWLCAENEGNSQVNAEGTYKAGNDTGNNWYNTLEGNYTFTLDPAAMELTINRYEVSGVESIEVETPGEVVYYNMQGQLVENPSNGIFIRIANGKTTKVVK